MEWQELDIEQNTKEWLKARLQRFTASRIGSLFVEPRTKKARLAGELSETAKTYIIEVVTEKIHKKPVVESLDKVRAINYGKIHEPNAVDWYEAYHEIETQPSGFFVGGEWLGASPDRLIVGGGTWEAKCAYNSIEHTKRCLSVKNGADLLKYNKMYWYQVQFQMYATSSEWGHWVSYDPDLITNDEFNFKAMHVVEMEFDTSIDFKGKTEAAILHAENLFKEYSQEIPESLSKVSRFINTI